MPTDRFDGISGKELCKTDGTDAGTLRVKDINPAGDSLLIFGDRGLTNINGTLYFGATNGANGFEPRKSDGTLERTVQIKDVNPGADDGWFNF